MSRSADWRRVGCGLLLLAGCARVPKEEPVNQSAAPAHFLGLRTAKYTAPDLAAAKAWYADVLGITPYFDEPFYVGFNVGGFELGITPDSNAAHERVEAGVAYWGVTNADSAYVRLLTLGATPYEPVADVGGGIRVAAVRDPFGNLLGVIENPSFRIAEP